MKNDRNFTNVVRVSPVPPPNTSIDDAWRIVADLYCEAVHPPGPSAYLELEGELLFCLLGGFGVTYEHGRSAAAAISSLAPFSEDWCDGELFEAIAVTLMRPQFEPRRQDGSLRRYRFPRHKASTIVNARRWLRDNATLSERIHAMQSCKERRGAA